MDAIVSAKIPYEVKNELMRLSHINNDLTLSDIVRRAIDYYISSGKLENEFKYFKSKKPGDQMNLSHTGRNHQGTGESSPTTPTRPGRGIRKTEEGKADSLEASQ